MHLQKKNHWFWVDGAMIFSPLNPTIYMDKKIMKWALIWHEILDDIYVLFYKVILVIKRKKKNKTCMPEKVTNH